MKIGELNKIKAHVPDRLIDNNLFADKFLELIQKLIDYKDEQVGLYEDRYNVFFEGNIEILKKYVDEFGGDYAPIYTKRILECLYLKKHDIYSRKGTIEGLIILINCLVSTTTLSIAQNTAPNLLHTRTAGGCVLPNGIDIADEIDNVYVPTKYVPTLLGDSWSELYQTVRIRIKLTGTRWAGLTTQEAKDFLIKLCGLYLGLDVSSTTFNIDIRYTSDRISIFN